jgi:hypothetical protein
VLQAASERIAGSLRTEYPPTSRRNFRENFLKGLWWYDEWYSLTETVLWWSSIVYYYAEQSLTGFGGRRKGYGARASSAGVATPNFGENLAKFRARTARARSE